MEVLGDGMDLDLLAGSGIDFRAKSAYLSAATAAAAAGIGGGRDAPFRRPPPMPLSVPPPMPAHRPDGNGQGLPGVPPSPQSVGGGGGGLSPLSARMSYDNVGNGNGRAAAPDRSVMGPLDLSSLRQLILQQPGAFSGVPQSVLIRLLMQAQQAAPGGGAGPDAGGVPQGTPRSSSGGSGAGGGQSCFPGASAGNGAAVGGGGGRAVMGGQQPSGKTGGSDGSGGDDYRLGSEVALADVRLGFRPQNGSTQLDVLPAPPSSRNSSGGIGSIDSGDGDGDPVVGGGKGSLSLSPEALRALLAANGHGSGLGGMGAAVESGAITPAQLHSFLQHVGGGSGGVGGGGFGGSGSISVGGITLSGLLVAALKEDLPQFLACVASANGRGGDGGGGGGILSARLAANGGGGHGLEALAGVLKEGGGKVVGGGAPPGLQQSVHSLLLQQVLQQQQQHQPGALPSGFGPGSAALAGLPLPGLGPFGAGGNGGQLKQQHHNLSAGMGVNGQRIPVNGLDALVDDPVEVPSASAAAAAAAAPAREVANSGDSRGAVAVGRGSGRTQRNGSSELGGGAGGGGNSKGPTGLKSLKNLVSSGAATAGVAGLMNGSGGLADLAVLPGAVATQLMEDLESLGYRSGMGGNLIGGHGRRGSGGAAGGAAGRSSSSDTAGARTTGHGAGHSAGQGAASGGARSRFVPPPASTPAGLKKPNKRPENGSLATQILKRQRYALAMQQASCSDSCSVGGGGTSVSLSVVPPPPPPASLLASADPSALLDPGGAGLGGLVGAGAVPPGLAGVLAGLPPAAAAAAAAGLPPVAATAGLLASQATGVNAAGLAHSAAAVRKSVAAGGLSMIHGGVVARKSVWGPLPAAGGTSAVPSAAQLRALALANLPKTSLVAAQLAVSRAQGLVASHLLGHEVPKKCRSRRSARPTGPMKMRNIMRDLGIHLLKRASGEAWQPEQDPKADPAQRSGSSGGGGSGGGNSGNGSSDADGAAGLSAPSMRRQRANPALTAAPVPPAPVDAGTMAAAAAPPLPATRAGSGAEVGDQQGDSPMTDAAAVPETVKLVAGGGAGNGILNGALGGAATLGGLNWEVLARCAAAGGPLAATIAQALGLPLGGETAALLSAAAARAAANKALPAVAGFSNGSGRTAVASAPLPTRPAAAAGAAAATAGASAGRGATGGPAPGPAGKAGPAGPAGKATAAAATAAAPGGGGASTAAAAPAAAAGKSRRKGGAPSRAAD